MITDVSLHANQQAQLKGAELEQIRNLAITEFPYPVAVSFDNFFKALNKDDKTLALVIFANDVTTTVFQFLSLILASEYIESNAPRTLRMYQAIENMTYRPGPGKWLGFMREFYNYQQQIPGDLGKFPQVLDFIQKHEINKKSALLKVEENSGDSPSKKLGLLELMVNLRNNFAHSKGYDDETLSKIVNAVEQIVHLIAIDLAFLKKYKLILSFTESEDPVFLMGAELPDMRKKTGESFVIIENGETRSKLFPMFIKDSIAKGKTQDVFLLEALDNKKVFYASNRHLSEKRTDKDPLANELAHALQKIHVEPEVLDATKVGMDQLNSRTMQYTGLMLAEYELNGKYNEEVYVLPEGYGQIANDFFSSDKKIIFLRDDQGSGKSAFCAHLANQYVKSNQSEMMNFLLDARHLDEMADAAMLFDDFIKKKLGIAGDLHDMLKNIERKHPNTTFVITIDNMNEYYLKGTEQSMLMERLFDFIYRFKDISTIQIIAIARPEYFKKSIEKYARQFKDKKIEELTFRPQSDVQGRPLITTLLPALSQDELGQIWKNYGTYFTGYTPKTSWEELNDTLKEHCKKPLIMLYLLKEYDNKTIPGRLSTEDIKMQYIEGILKNKAFQDTLFELIKQMNKDKCPYLLTENMDDKLLRKINDSSRDTKTALPYNHAYTALTEMQLLREEKVRKDDLTGKKITLNNEMSMNIVLEKFKKEEKKKSLRFNIVLNVGPAFLVYALLFSIYSGLVQDIQSYNTPVLSVIFNQIFTPDFNVKGDITAIVADIFYANYAMKSVLDQLFIPAVFIVAYAFLVFAGFLFIQSKMENKGMNSIRSLNIYEVFHFKSLGLAMFQKLVIFGLILLVILIIIPMIILLVYPELDPKYNYLIKLLVIYGFSVIVFVAMLWYKAIIVEKNAYVEYLRKSNYSTVKYFLISTYFFSFALFILFYFSDTIMSYTQERVYNTYVSKFEGKIEQIHNIATFTDIENLKNRIEAQNCSDPQDAICLLLEDIVNGLNKDKIQLFANEPEANEMLSAFTQELKKHTNYWYFFLFGPAALMLVLISMLEIPIFLASRKLNKEEELSIA